MNRLPSAWQFAALHFVTYGARALVIPFISLYLVSVGFTGTQIGTLVSVIALAQLVITPALHTFADRTGQHRRLYYGLATLNILTSFSLTLPVRGLLLGGITLLRDLSDMPNAALLSQLTITWVTRERRAIYSRIRAFGSLGWALIALVSGPLYNLGGYALLFAASAVLNLISLPLVRILPERTVEKAERQPKAVPRQPGLYILMASLFLFFAGLLAVNTFGYVYFEQELGADKTMIGILAGASALGEFPLMLYMDSLLRRWNLRLVLVAGVAGLSLMMFTYTLLSGPLLLIPLMLIRGAFFTLWNISTTLLIAQISHPANAATNQVIGQVTMPGLATLVAGPVAGLIYDAAGGRILLRIGALLGLLAAGLLVLGRNRLVAYEN